MIGFVQKLFIRRQIKPSSTEKIEHKNNPNFIDIILNKKRKKKYFITKKVLITIMDPKSHRTGTLTRSLISQTNVQTELVI